MPLTALLPAPRPVPAQPRHYRYGDCPPVVGPVCAIANDVAPATKTATIASVLILIDGSPNGSTENRPALSIGDNALHNSRFRHGNSSHCTAIDGDGESTIQPRKALPNQFGAVTHAGRATWRSGYAAVCKTVYPGSIPGVASTDPLPVCAPHPRRRLNFNSGRRGRGGFQSGIGFVICGPSSRRAGYSPVAQR